MEGFWSSVLYFLVGAAIGAAVAFFLTKRKFEKEIKENPPINEKMIRAMYLQMGRKPTEAQIRQVMKAFNGAGGNSSSPTTKTKSKK
ncbi:MAG: YneF family protein [Allobaculum sp.]|nr:YneF family protein [Allobaculum sp.]